MKVFLLILCGLLFSAGAAELKPLPWSENICRAARFAPWSSGKMSITDDPVEKAVRFEVEFPPGVDRWVYPHLRLWGAESLADVEQIRFEFRTEPEVKCRSAYVMFGDRKPYFNLPVPKTEYRTVTIDVASAVANPAATRNLQIGMNPEAPKLVYFIRNLEFLSTKAPKLISDASLAVAAEAPGAAFVQGEVLKFSLKPLAAQPAKWSVKNWKSETIRQGEWSGSELLLEALPGGYYTLELDGFTHSRSFAVVPDPAKRAPNPDLYFAMDSAQSWLARPFPNNPRLVENAYEVVSEVARRAGLQMVRERMHWNEYTEPAPGVFDWQQYLPNAEYLSKRGIAVLGMFHNTPLRNRRDGDAMLPNDLLATYNFAKTVAETFKGKMTVWEFWNEQDSSGFTAEGAWDYASALKAACLGFKAGNPDLPVAIGGYTGTDNFTYAEAVMKSGAAGYFDIFNLHTYDAIAGYPEMMKTVHAHMRRYGIENLPVWFTEHGTRMEGVGKLENYVPDHMMHSPDQELLQAEFMFKAMITLQNLGVARDFFFVLPPFNEAGGRKDWGLMRRDFTVKPGFAVFATLVDKLGTATPLGEVKLGDGLKGYLYRQKDGSDTLLYWSMSPFDTDESTHSIAYVSKLSAEDPLERSFKLPGASRRLHGVDSFGTPLAVDSVRVTATRFPAILEKVTGLRVTARALPPGSGRPAERAGIDKTVIFRTELSDGFETFASRDCVNVEKPAKFKLQIWNLSSAPKTGGISAAGGEFTGIPAEITLPAFGKQELELLFTPEWRPQGELRVEGVFGGLKVTPLVIPLINRAEMFRNGRKLDMTRMLKPENWRKNSAGEMTIAYDKADKAIAFRTVFAPETKDRWSYPEFVLLLPKESQKNLLGVAFEVKVSGKVEQLALMAVKSLDKERGNYVICRVQDPPEEWEERFVPYLQPHLVPEKIKQLRIGVNALCDDVTVSLRNIRFIYRD